MKTLVCSKCGYEIRVLAKAIIDATHCGVYMRPKRKDK